jgi:hypothetical protein
METFALNRLAEAFEVDRSTMVRAMRHVPPDLVKPGNRPTWKTSTAARALERHRQKNDGGNGRGLSYPGLPQLIDKIESDFNAFDAGFAKLEAEPDLARRRKLDKQLGVGALIGGLDRQLRQANAAISEERGLGALVGEHLVGDLISKFLTLLDYWPDDAEMNKLRAEGNGRRAGHRGD